MTTRAADWPTHKELAFYLEQGAKTITRRGKTIIIHPAFATIVDPREPWWCPKCGGLDYTVQSQARASYGVPDSWFLYQHRVCTACNGRRQRQKNHNLSANEQLAMIVERHGRCDICGTNASPPEIDHDHTTGKVRGVLCGIHNRGIGLFRDDPVLLRRAADYLEETANA